MHRNPSSFSVQYCKNNNRTDTSNFYDNLENMYVHNLIINIFYNIQEISQFFPDETIYNYGCE